MGGTGPAKARNYFGLGVGKNFQGAAGSITVTFQGKNYQFSSFDGSGILPAGESFAGSPEAQVGRLHFDVRGYGQALVDAGFNSEKLSPPYVDQLQSELGDVVAAIGICLGGGN